MCLWLLLRTLGNLAGCPSDQHKNPPMVKWGRKCENKETDRVNTDGKIYCKKKTITFILVVLLFTGIQTFLTKIIFIRKLFYLKYIYHLLCMNMCTDTRCETVAWVWKTKSLNVTEYSRNWWTPRDAAAWQGKERNRGSVVFVRNQKCVSQEII